MFILWESILAKAKICRHCKSRLKLQSWSMNKNIGHKSGVYIIRSVIFLLFVSVAWFNKRTEEKREAESRQMLLDMEETARGHFRADN